MPHPRIRQADDHAARVGASLLSAAALPELITRSEDDFVALAVSLAKDKPRLASYRDGMRERLKGSPLLNAPLHAAGFYTALRDAWRRWCAGGLP